MCCNRDRFPRCGELHYTLIHCCIDGVTAGVAMAEELCELESQVRYGPIPIRPEVS